MSNKTTQATTKLAPTVLPDAEYERKWSEESSYQLLRKSHDPRFGEIMIYKRRGTNDLIFAKEKLVTSKQAAANDIREMKSRMALNRPGLQRMLGYSTSIKKELCSTSYLTQGFYEFPKSDLAKEISTKTQNGAFFTEPELGQIASQALQGLNSLHQEKITHGDIRPQYLGISHSTNQTEILDRLADPAPLEKTQTAHIVNKKNLYMSPELYKKLQGKDKMIKYDPAKNDLYALGLSILEAGNGGSIQDIYNANGTMNQAKLDGYVQGFNNRYKGGYLSNFVNMSLASNEASRPTSTDFISRLGSYSVTSTGGQAGGQFGGADQFASQTGGQYGSGFGQAQYGSGFGQGQYGSQFGQAQYGAGGQFNQGLTSEGLSSAGQTTTTTTTTTYGTTGANTSSTIGQAGGATGGSTALSFGGANQGGFGGATGANTNTQSWTTTNVVNQGGSAGGATNTATFADNGPSLFSQWSMGGANQGGAAQGGATNYTTTTTTYGGQTAQGGDADAGLFNFSNNDASAWNTSANKTEVSANTAATLFGNDAFFGEQTTSGGFQLTPGTAKGIRAAAGFRPPEERPVGANNQSFGTNQSFSTQNQSFQQAPVQISNFSQSYQAAPAQSLGQSQSRIQSVTQSGYQAQPATQSYSTTQSFQAAPAQTTSYTQSTQAAPAQTTTYTQSYQAAPAQTTASFNSQAQAPQAQTYASQTSQAAPAQTTTYTQSYQAAPAQTTTTFSSQAQAPQVHTYTTQTSQAAPAQTTTYTQSYQAAPAQTTTYTSQAPQTYTTQSYSSQASQPIITQSFSSQQSIPTASYTTQAAPVTTTTSASYVIPPSGQTTTTTQTYTLPNPISAQPTIISAAPSSQTYITAQPASQTYITAQPATQTFVSAQPISQTYISTQPATQTYITAQPATQTFISAQPTTVLAGSQTYITTEAYPSISNQIRPLTPVARPSQTFIVSDSKPRPLTPVFQSQYVTSPIQYQAQAPTFTTSGATYITSQPNIITYAEPPKTVVTAAPTIISAAPEIQFAKSERIIPSQTFTSTGGLSGYYQPTTTFTTGSRTELPAIGEISSRKSVTFVDALKKNDAPNVISTQQISKAYDGGQAQNFISGESYTTTTTTIAAPATGSHEIKRGVISYEEFQAMKSKDPTLKLEGSSTNFQSQPATISYTTSAPAQESKTVTYTQESKTYSSPITIIEGDKYSNGFSGSGANQYTEKMVTTTYNDGAKFDDSAYAQEYQYADIPMYAYGQEKITNADAFQNYTASGRNVTFGNGEQGGLTAFANLNGQANVTHTTKHYKMENGQLIEINEN